MKVSLLLIAVLVGCNTSIYSQSLSIQIENDALNVKNRPLVETPIKSIIHIWVTNFESEADYTLLRVNMMEVDGISEVDIAPSQERLTVRIANEFAKQEVLDIISGFGLEYEVMEGGPPALIRRKRTR